MVFVRKAYCDTAVFGTTVIKEKSIVEPGQCLPMNKLIRGVINGSVVINPRFMEYDFKESYSDEFEPGSTPDETMKAQNDAFVGALDKQSNIPADPTASPSFDAVDAENLQQSIAAAQAAAAEGERAQVGEGGAAPQKQSDDEPVT